MCGIAGIISFDDVVQSKQLLTIRDSMSHRGPDAKGYWLENDSSIGFAHNRLAVVDLSEESNQPMLDSSNRFVIVFNGEIYNYKELKKELVQKRSLFRTQGDTEVILELYKERRANSFASLQGQFALALYDRLEKKVIFARDRAGEKPLFYIKTSKYFAFASELKALFSLPGFERKLDAESLDFYLTYGYAPPNKSLIQGVKKLLPGEYLTFDLATQHQVSEKYWCLPSLEDPLSQDKALLKLEELLQDSVHQVLQADVPVGVLLSGGLDSSLITAIASRTSPKPIKTFTVSFKGHGKYDESHHAEKVASFFNTQHIELEVNQASVEIIPHLVEKLDEPIADHAVIPSYQLSKLVREHVTVALGGDGGDELFGGYPHYSFMYKNILPLRKKFPQFFRNTISDFATNCVPVGMKSRNHFIGLRGDLGNSISHINLLFDKESRKKLLVRASVNQFLAENYKAELYQAEPDVLLRMLKTDFVSTLPSAYLTKVDRASMLNSLEIRAPFLHPIMIDFAYSKLPSSLKATSDKRKIMLRLLAQKLLPQDLDISRKQGFTMPLNEWYKGEWGSYMKHVLMESEMGLLNKSYVSHLLRLQDRGHSNINRIYALVILEEWLRINKVSV